jgi:hypothetical protein
MIWIIFGALISVSIFMWLDVERQIKDNIDKMDM